MTFRTTGPLPEGVLDQACEFNRSATVNEMVLALAHMKAAYEAEKARADRLAEALVIVKRHVPVDVLRYPIREEGDPLSRDTPRLARIIKDALTAPAPEGEG